jgi:hypothetical protein
MRVTTLVVLFLAGTLTLASRLPAQAELRVDELAVFLNAATSPFTPSSWVPFPEFSRSSSACRLA